MKRYSIIAFLTILSSYLYAQDVWIEGTTWDVEYTQESNLPHTLFTLMEAMYVEGVLYYPLSETTTEGCDTVAYIRSEHGDSLVYARVFNDGLLLNECLLFDFSKSFEYGDLIPFGTIYGVDTKFISSVDNDSITYFYDVFEKGDSIPMWNGIIYKIGHIGGPLGLFFTYPEHDGPVKPKPTNVSHILFGTRKGGSKVSYSQPETNSIDNILTHTNNSFIYNLHGIRLYRVPQRGLYIIDGKKVMR